MKHKHSHCPHTQLAFCQHCNVVYCKDCDQEWQQVSQPYQVPTTTWWTNTYRGPFLGNAIPADQQLTNDAQIILTSSTGHKHE